MSQERTSLKPIEGAAREMRRRLSLRQEFILALLPTITVLMVFLLVEIFTQQRLLFASLASSAFLIYLDPYHGTNTIRTLVVAQMLAASTGLAIYLFLGPGYLSGGSAMIVTIVMMILLDTMHPPAVSTSLSFAFRAGDISNLALFGLTLAMTTVLIILEQGGLSLLAYYTKNTNRPETEDHS
ncbi:MAG: hypothetical protein KatS3mg057_1413 [Herpetosiphonaceae bacterium]|nr:MAG: hypothetical protein KatS3mg057_1413 [Herpetosiphonaceae bacterium]